MVNNYKKTAITYLGGVTINVKKAKAYFSFNEFLLSLAGEPLEIKYKHMSMVFHVSQSTLSKLRHNKLSKMPGYVHPDVMADCFTDGVVQSFTSSVVTVRLFASYARMLIERYYCSDTLNELAMQLCNVNPIDEVQVRVLYNDVIPKFIKQCYEESYANTDNGDLVKNSDTQSEVYYQRICDTLNRDMFDSEKLKQLLSVVYAASIRRQLSMIAGDASLLEIPERFIRSQFGKPYYKSLRRTEVISISEDSTEITRRIKEQKQIVLQILQPQEIVIKQSFNHVVDTSSDEVISNLIQDFTCTVNHIPLVQYINMHENTNYISLKQFLSVKLHKNMIDGIVTTDVNFKFNLYPTIAGEAITVIHEYTAKAPFIRNVSCNYSYRLLYPCKFFEHEFMLDANTKSKWGVHIKVFAPLTNSAFNPEDSENVIFQNDGTSNSKRITFYDWALPGSGYYRNLYELQYTNGEIK